TGETAGDGRVANPDGDWLAYDEAIAWIGAPRWPGDGRPAQAHEHDRNGGHDRTGTHFAYDNESPRHRVLLGAYGIARGPVSNARYADFVADGGYTTPTLWLSDGWDRAQREGWERPLYWHEDGAREFTLAGWR